MQRDQLELWQLNLLVEIMYAKALDETNKETKKWFKLSQGRPVGTKEDLDAFEKHLNELRSNKFHDIGKTTLTLDKLTSMRDNYSTEALVEMQHVHDGWDCPNSPDKICHYYSTEKPDGFYVTLNGGKEHKILKYSKKDHENEEEDWCIFCGEPEERK